MPPHNSPELLPEITPEVPQEMTQATVVFSVAPEMPLEPLSEAGQSATDRWETLTGKLLRRPVRRNSAPAVMGPRLGSGP